jgi:hypothetical protein
MAGAGVGGSRDGDSVMWVALQPGADPDRREPRADDMLDVYHRYPEYWAGVGHWSKMTSAELKSLVGLFLLSKMIEEGTHGSGYQGGTGWR